MLLVEEEAQTSLREQKKGSPEGDPIQNVILSIRGRYNV